jgi:methionine-rich copper-binding protein CopC
MCSRMIRLIMAAGLVFGITTALPRVAEAHAFLQKCAGLSKGAVLTALPKVLTCTFAEGVNPKGSFLRIVEATGDGGEDDLGNSTVPFTCSLGSSACAHEMTVGVPKLAKGPYYLMWFTISADDGHKAGGVVPFTIK